MIDVARAGAYAARSIREQDRRGSAKFNRYFPDCTAKCQRRSRKKEAHRNEDGTQRFCRVLYPKHVAFMEDRWPQYFYSCHYLGEAEPPTHASAIQGRGNWIPGRIDPAARGRSQADGQQLLNIYTRLGLKVQPAPNAVEAGIYEVWTRLSAGRIRIFKSLQSVFEELRVYRRNDKGKVVKERDHLMDAMRYYVLACVETKFTWLQTDVASVVAPPPYRPQGVWM